MQRMNRRQMLKTLGAGAATMALAACAPGVAPSAPAASGDGAAAAPAAEAPTVVLWSSFGGQLGEAQQALADRFNEEMAGKIVLDYQYQGSYEETAQKVTAALQARTAPDVSVLSDVWWFKFYVSENLVALDDLLAAQNVDLTDYQDPLINEGFRNGVHWWIPFARSTPLFYYNKEKWAEAGLPDRGPETWMEYMEWAPKLVKMDGDQMTTSAFAYPNGASYIAWLFQGVTWQFGGKYSDPDFTMHMLHEDTIRAGQFYKDTVHTWKWAVPSADHQADFVNGLTAAAMLSTGSMGGVRENATFEFGTAFLPKERNFGCCTGGAGLSILSSTPEERRAAALEYIVWASSTEITTWWSQTTGYMPVRKSAVESADMQTYFAENPQFKTAVDQLPLTLPQDSARVWVPGGDQIIGGGLERITVQSDDVATAFGDVQATLEAEAAPIIEALAVIES
jgi:sn-glycerol 3-phosphate transport system substrate-binding protein